MKMWWCRPRHKWVWPLDNCIAVDDTGHYGFVIDGHEKCSPKGSYWTKEKADVVVSS